VAALLVSTLVAVMSAWFCPSRLGISSKNWPNERMLYPGSAASRIEAKELVVRETSLLGGRDTASTWSLGIHESRLNEPDVVLDESTCRNLYRFCPAPTHVSLSRSHLEHFGCFWSHWRVKLALLRALYFLSPQLVRHYCITFFLRARQTSQPRPDGTPGIADVDDV
jgi:hypothetical protein